jgi:hypothetical protein
LFLTGKPCCVVESREVMWWGEMHVLASPITDYDNAVFALRLVMTNRSKTDTAIFREQWGITELFDVSVIAGTEHAKRVTIDSKSSPVDSTQEEPGIVEIPPASNVTFCLKMEHYLLPNVAANLQSNSLTSKYIAGKLAVKIFGTLAWRRSSGYVTPFSYEDESQLASGKRYYGPRLGFGEQKITVHRNRGCD